MVDETSFVTSNPTMVVVASGTVLFHSLICAFQCCCVCLLRTAELLIFSILSFCIHTEQRWDTYFAFRVKRKCDYHTKLTELCRTFTFKSFAGKIALQLHVYQQFYTTVLILGSYHIFTQRSAKKTSQSFCVCIAQDYCSPFIVDFLPFQQQQKKMKPPQNAMVDMKQAIVCHQIYF